MLLLLKKKLINIILLFILICNLTITISCKDEEINDPWGVWNEHVTPFDEDDIVIRTINKKKYYEISLSGVYFYKNGNERIATIGKGTPIIAIQGEHYVIDKTEEFLNGFIFTIIGKGINYDTFEFKNNTMLQIKMYFINKDECYFEYISVDDGFHLSYFLEENVIYKRFMLKDNHKFIISEDNIL